VLLDPIMSRLDAKLDSHKDMEVRLALEPVVDIADRSGAAVLGIIHVNKGTGSDPLTAIMGSRAFVAVARAVLFAMIDPDHEERHLLGQPKNNLGRADLPSMTFTIQTAHVADTDEGPIYTGRLVWGETDARSIAEALADSGDVDRSATSEAGHWLTGYLLDNGGTAESADIKRDGAAAGHSTDALKRARRKIKARYEDYGSPRRTRWILPGPAVVQSEQPSGESAPTALTTPTQQTRGVEGQRRSDQSEQSEQPEQPPGTLLQPDPDPDYCRRCGRDYQSDGTCPHCDGRAS
jgi:hypothetical protein